GERLTAVPDARALGAFLYLVVFGSMVAYSAYTFLLANVRPALATSYAYVTPVVAVLLGALLARGRVTSVSVAALAPLLTGVALVATRGWPREPVRVLPQEADGRPAGPIARFELVEPGGANDNAGADGSSADAR